MRLAPMRLANWHIALASVAFYTSAGRSTGDPTPSHVSPATVTPGQSITVTGTDLLKTGFVAELQYKKKYRTTSTESALGIVSATSQTATALVFPVPANMQPTGLLLRYRSTSKLTAGSLLSGDTSFMSRAPFPIAGRVDVLEAPEITTNFGIWATTNASGQVVFGPIVIPGTLVLQGKNLVPAPGGNVTVTFNGVTLQQTSAPQYDPSGNGGLGIDNLALQVNEPSATTIADLVVTTAGGSGTKPRALVPRRPHVSAVEEVNSFGTVIGPAGGKLVRGHRYQIRGGDFAAPATPPLFVTTHVRLAGTELRGNDTTIDAAHVRFIVPTTISASSGLLEVLGLVGVASGSAGAFTISDPGTPPPPISDVIVAPSPAVWGSQLSATVAFAGSVASGSDVGTLIVTSPSGSGDFVGLPITVPITSNPQTIAIPSHVRSTSATRTLRFHLSRASGGVDSLDRSASFVPPTLTGLTLASATVGAGGSTSASASFDFPSGGGGSCSSFLTGQPDLVIDVFTSDTSVVVGNPLGGNHVCVTQNPMPITLLSHPTSAAKTVTITAKQGQVTKTATLQVTAPMLTAVSTNRPSMTAMQSATGTLTMNAPLPNTPAFLSSSDPSVAVPAKLVLGSSATTAFAITSAPVSTQRSVTISAAVNGVTQSTTLSLIPLQIASVAISPSTVRAGSNAAVTVSLNATIDLPLTVSLKTSDPSVVTVPGSLQFAAGQSAAVFSAQTVSPQATQKLVTITATYSVTLPNGTVVSTTQTGSLSVTP